MPLWDTNKLYKYGYIYKHYAVLWSWILKMHRDNNATGIFMKFGNVYEQLNDMHITVPGHCYQNDKYSYEIHCNIWGIIMYKLTSLQYLSHLKCVNKY